MRFVLFILTLGASIALFIKDINADNLLFLVYHILNSLLIFTIEEISKPYFMKMKDTKCEVNFKEIPLVVKLNPLIILFLQISGVSIVATLDISMFTALMYFFAGYFGRCSSPKRNLTNLHQPDMELLGQISFNPTAVRAKDILEDISSRIYNREMTGRKTQYPVIVKKIEEGYFLCIPDMKKWVFIKGNIIPKKEAELFLHRTISLYKENNKNLPFSSLIEENMLIEGESLLYVQSTQNQTEKIQPI